MKRRIPRSIIFALGAVAIGAAGLALRGTLRSPALRVFSCGFDLHNRVAVLRIENPTGKWVHLSHPSVQWSNGEHTDGTYIPYSPDPRSALARARTLALAERTSKALRYHFSDQSEHTRLVVRDSITQQGNAASDLCAMLQDVAESRLAAPMTLGWVRDAIDFQARVKGVRPGAPIRPPVTIIGPHASLDLAIAFDSPNFDAKAESVTLTFVAGHRGIPQKLVCHPDAL